MVKSKKIALVSVWNHNYGSLLQTYAVQSYLKTKGYSNEIIMYSDKSKLRVLLRATNSGYLKAKFKLIWRKLFFQFGYPSLNQGLKIRAKKFESFKQNNLVFSSPIYSMSNLIYRIKDYDQVVLGSDQVLHPTNLLMNYFNLNFVPSNIKKIGYAPSFGVSEVPKNQINRTNKYLNRFDFLSVRENSGKDIVYQLTKRNVPVVCDPTILVNKQIWDNLIEDVPDMYDKPYVFCYFLGTNIEHRKFATDLGRLTNCKIVVMKYLDEFVKSDLQFGDDSPFDVGPKEFVKLISKAKYVLTDSFHATIFSILFHRDFFTFKRFKSGTKASTNSRIYNLLEQLNLSDRLVAGDEKIDILLNRKIDFDKVDNELNLFRNDSEKYFISALLA